MVVVGDMVKEIHCHCEKHCDYLIKRLFYENKYGNNLEARDPAMNIFSHYFPF